MKTLNSSPVIGIAPNLLLIETPALSMLNHTIDYFGDVAELKMISTTRNWCLDDVSTVESFKASEAHEDLMFNLNDLNETSSTFTKKNLSKVVTFFKRENSSEQT